jgi:MFS family permease
MFAGTIALMAPALAPFLLGKMVEQATLTEAQLGLIATLESLALALACGLAPKLLRRGSFRAQTAAASLLLATANLATLATHSVPIIACLRSLAGMAEGLMLGVTIVVIVHHAAAERLNALFQAAATVPQAVAAYALPALVLPRWGLTGGYALLAAVTLLNIPMSARLRNPAPSVRAPAGTRRAVPPAVLAALMAICLQNAAIGAAWNYIDSLARDHGISATTVGVAASGCMALQVIGALFVAWVGWRLPNRPVLIVAALLQAAIIHLIGSSSSVTVYVAGLLLFGLFWLATSPFQLRLLLQLDDTRAAASLLGGVTVLGLSLGPLIGAAATQANDVSGAYTLASVLMIGALGSYGAAIALSTVQPAAKRPQ